MAQYEKLLITGAAGRLAQVLRPATPPLAPYIRLSDILPLPDKLAAHEAYVQCDLADQAAINELVSGVDAIVHLGGTPHEWGFESVLRANLVGLFNIYDAARQCGVKRVVLASSNHVTGYYRTDEHVDITMPMRPDSIYAVSKGYGELLARFFYDRHNIETVALRIGSCHMPPNNHRALAAWLSHGDFLCLVRCALTAPNVGFAVVYGVSNNPVKWWGKDDADRIGYRPQDSAAEYADEIAKLPPLPEDEPARIWQGGQMVRTRYFAPDEDI